MYLTAQKYEEITGRPQAEATAGRIQKASYLLDARIGNYPIKENGYKLDLEELPKNQVDAVQLWVSELVLSLADNNDTIQGKGNVRLGRFQSSENEATNRTIMPDNIFYADKILKASGVINLSVRNRKVIRDNESGYVL